MTVKKDEDLYEMAIQYKKEEDFAGWYTDVSIKLLADLLEASISGLKLML